MSGFGQCESGSCNVGCVQGATECPDSFDPYGRTICTSLLFDPTNCVARGNVCGPGEWCAAGTGHCCPINTSC